MRVCPIRPRMRMSESRRRALEEPEEDAPSIWPRSPEFMAKRNPVAGLTSAILNFAHSNFINIERRPSTRSNPVITPLGRSVRSQAGAPAASRQAISRKFMLITYYRRPRPADRPDQTLKGKRDNVKESFFLPGRPYTSLLSSKYLQLGRTSTCSVLSPFILTFIAV